MQFAMMRINYGPFKRRQSYPVLEEGYDWMRLKNKGKLYYVSKDFIVKNPHETLIDDNVEDDREGQEETYEDYVNEYC